MNRTVLFCALLGAALSSIQLVGALLAGSLLAVAFVLLVGSLLAGALLAVAFVLLVGALLVGSLLAGALLAVAFVLLGVLLMAASESFIVTLDVLLVVAFGMVDSAAAAAATAPEARLTSGFVRV